MNPWNSPTDIAIDSGVAPARGQSLEEHVRQTWAWVLSDRFEEEPPAVVLRPFQDPDEKLGLFNGPGLSGRTQRPEEVQPSTTPRPGFVDIWDLDALNKALDERGLRNLRTQVHNSGISNGTASWGALDNSSNHKTRIHARGSSTTTQPTTALVECPPIRYHHLPPSAQLPSFGGRNAPQNDALRQIFQDVDNIVSSTPSQHTPSNIESLTMATGQGSAAALEMAKQSIRVKYGIQTENITQNRL